MTLPEICITRPVFATVLSLVILLVGLISYPRLSVREYPRIDEPVVSVSTTYRGASAEVVESQVTKVLEDSLSGIEGVELMTSQSRSERSQINVRFRLSRDPDSAAADVRDKVSRVRATAARGGRRAGHRQGRGRFAARSSTSPSRRARRRRSRPPTTSTRYIKPRLSVLPGAADVRIFGERQVSMRINLDRTRLAGYRLTVQDVEDAIRRQNVEIPGGPHRIDDARVHRRRRDRRADARAVRADHRRQRRRLPGAHPRRRHRRGRRARRARRSRATTASPSLNIGVIKQAVANPLELSQARARRGRQDQREPAAGHEARRRLRHVGVHRPLDHVGVHDDRRGDRARRAGDLLLPAQPARDDHPDRHDPGVADRRVRADVRCSASRSTR